MESITELGRVEKVFLSRLFQHALEQNIDFAKKIFINEGWRLLSGGAFSRLIDNSVNNEERRKLINIQSKQIGRERMDKLLKRCRDNKITKTSCI